jgi:hypothetical protein
MTDLARIDHAPEHAEPSALMALRLAIASLDDQRAELAEAGDYATLARGLAALRTLSQDLRTLARSVEDDVARLVPERRTEVPGLGVLERRKATDRKAWRWAEVLNDSLPILLERNHGSVMDALGELIQMLPLNASTGPRLAVFRDDLGLDPQEYAECTPGRQTIQIIGGAK